jgi:hypothetical protein
VTSFDFKLATIFRAGQPLEIPISEVSKHFGGGHCHRTNFPGWESRHGQQTTSVKMLSYARAYLRAAQAYMLISMPTGTSTILGVFQAIELSFTNGDGFPPLRLNLMQFKKFASDYFAVKRNVFCAAVQKKLPGRLAIER